MDSDVGVPSLLALVAGSAYGGATASRWSSYLWSLAQSPVIDSRSHEEAVETARTLLGDCTEASRSGLARLEACEQYARLLERLCLVLFMLFISPFIFRMLRFGILRLHSLVLSSTVQTVEGQQNSSRSQTVRRRHRSKHLSLRSHAAEESGSEPTIREGSSGGPISW